MSAASAVAVADRMIARARSASNARSLTPEALEVVSKPAPRPISPIVLAGFVRMTEFALVLAVGLALYAIYLPPMHDLIWRYSAASFLIALLSTLAFQTADIYQVQAFRGYEKQYMRLASAWSVVFLIVIGASFFAKAGDMFSRVWLGSYYIVGLCALIASRRLVFLLVRKWTREGRLNRRTVIVGGADAGAGVIEERRQTLASTSLVCSMIATMTAAVPNAPANASWERSTISSSSAAAPASISLSSHCRSRRNRASSKC